VSFSELEKFRNVLLPDNVTFLEGRPLELSRQDAGDVMGQHGTDCFFNPDLFHVAPSFLSFQNPFTPTLPAALSV
jgi:hypothetical protein